MPFLFSISFVTHFKYPPEAAFEVCQANDPRTSFFITSVEVSVETNKSEDANKDVLLLKHLIKNNSKKQSGEFS